VHRCAVLLLLLHPAWASAQECASYVVADVFDRKTTLGVEGLSAADFEARLGTIPLKIVSSTTRMDNRVLLLVEVAEAAEIPDAAVFPGTVADMARQMPEGGRVAFGAFAERAVFTKGFASSRRERTAQVDDVVSQFGSLGKQPAVFDALHRSLALFGERQPGDTIVLVGNGHDHHSKRNDEDIAREFALHGVRLLVMILPRGHILAKDAQARDRQEGITFRVLASRTGGAYTRTFGPHFADFAWSGYLLGVNLPEGMSKPKTWKLHLRGPAAKEHKDALIYYPEKLPPCARVPSVRFPEPLTAPLCLLRVIGRLGALSLELLD
jgi:hypothetical protein